MPTINRKRVKTNPNHKPASEEQGTKRAERIKIYASTRWKKLSAFYRYQHPLCEDCLDNDKVKPAEDIHHLISFMSTDDPNQREFLAYSFSNLKALCKECHQLRHSTKIIN